MHVSSTLQSHLGPVHTGIWSLDGNYILTGSNDRTIKLWNANTGNLVKSYSGHGKDVFDIAIPSLASDNNRFATCSADRQVFLWDVGSGKTLRRFEDHAQRVNCVAFNAEANVIVSGGYDATVKLWDTRSQSRKPLQSLTEAKDSVESLLVHHHEIIVGSVDGSVRSYDLRLGQMIQDEIHHPVTSVKLSHDRHCILIASLDQRLRLLDRDSGEILMVYEGHKNRDYRIAPCLNPEDTKVYCGSEDGRVFCWELVNGKVLMNVEAHERAVSCISHHPTEDRFISCSLDGLVKIWTA